MSDHDGLGPEGSYFEHKARREEEARRARGDAMFPVWITVLCRSTICTSTPSGSG